MTSAANPTNPAPKEARASENAKPHNLARNAGVVSALTILSRVLGLARDMTVAAYFGAGFATDAFFVAFRVPNLLRRIVAEGGIATAFVPVFTEEHLASVDRGRRALGSVIILSLTVTLPLIVLGYAYSDVVIHLLTPGFGIGSSKSQLASTLLRILLPFIALISVTAIVSGALNALGRFALPAGSSAIINFVTIIGLVATHNLADPPIRSLAWVTVAGAAVACTALLAQLSALGWTPLPAAPHSSPASLKVLRLLLPSVLSSSAYQIMIFVNTILASTLCEGSVSWLFYADRLFQFPIGVFSIAVATAAFPALSMLAATGDRAGFQSQLERVLRWVGFITIPAAAGLWFLADPIVSMLYGYRTFSPESVHQTALALRGYTIGLWSISCQAVLLRAFLAHKNSTIPSLVSTAAIILNIFLAVALMGPPHSSSSLSFAAPLVQIQKHLGITSLAHIGIALAGSISSLVSVVVLMTLLPKLNIELDGRHLLLTILKNIAAAACMSIALVLLANAVTNRYALCASGIAGGLAVYFGASLLFKSTEAHEALQLAGTYLQRIRQQKRNT